MNFRVNVCGLLIVLCIYLTSSLPVRLSTDSKWTLRGQTAWDLFQQTPCEKLFLGQNCINLKTVSRSQMNIYTAERASKDSSLTARFVETALGEYKDMDAAVVLDPYPDAHYGHTILVFLVMSGASSQLCERKEGKIVSHADGTQECMYMADTTSCRHRVGHSRRGRRRCEISYLPLIYDSSTVESVQRLECRSDIPGYKACPHVTTEKNLRCVNSARCSHQSYNRGSANPSLSWFNNLCISSCDYAVLISGGWNRFMNQPRHYENMKDMWKYLTGKGFREENIRAFFANNNTVDLDANTSTEDTLPATESTGILQYLGTVCSKPRRCIDNLILYLNGPATINGNMLLWDRNDDGLAAVSETLRIKSVLNTLEKCNARGFVIIADQNYAGHLIERVSEGRADGLNNYDKIAVITSSSKVSYAWDRQFTKKLIELDDVWIDTNRTMAAARKLDNLVEDMKKHLPDFDIQYLASERPDQTIIGDISQQPGCNVNIPVPDVWSEDETWSSTTRRIKRFSKRRMREIVRQDTQQSDALRGTYQSLPLKIQYNSPITKVLMRGSFG